MELVKNYVKKAMPSLSSDQMDTLMAKLEELGVLSVDDLSLVDPEDIKDTLPFIQCKRFVRAVKALEAGDQQFKIAVDGLLVNDHITSPIVALSYVFSMFYVCNVQYPPEMAFTLEFMQRVFFGINPERGSKAEKKGKKRHFIPPQVWKLVSQLKEFECKQKESEWAF
uniref:Uncharacterized protein n=1 Tax=Knipowitschia caucasica TaxID=637954 RepID=A0AAV2IYW1_KNICA